MAFNSARMHCLAAAFCLLAASSAHAVTYNSGTILAAPPIDLSPLATVATLGAVATEFAPALDNLGGQELDVAKVYDLALPGLDFAARSRWAPRLEGNRSEVARDSEPARRLDLLVGLPLGVLLGIAGLFLLASRKTARLFQS